MTKERLQEILAVTGMSQSGVGRLLGHDDRTVRYWISGQWPIPRADALALELLVIVRTRDLLVALGSRIAGAPSVGAIHDSHHLKPARAYELVTGETVDPRWFSAGRGRPRTKGAAA